MKGPAAKSTAVHEVLVNLPSGISNVTEWAKKQACWTRVQELSINWPESFIASLISKGEKKSAAKSARKEQRVLNGIEAQVIVCKAGPGFWDEALARGNDRKLLSVSETTVLTLASRMPVKLPNEMEANEGDAGFGETQREGYEAKL